MNTLNPPTGVSRELADDIVEDVAQAVGMGHGAWDMVSPKELVDGFVKVLTPRFLTPERIARVAHEVNRAYCQALGDNSQLPWEDAPEWQRESARMGVDLHMMGDFGPEASHAAWMQLKLDEGWTYGPEKNPELKQHPCLVPFYLLTHEQRAKDFLFRGVVHALKGAGQ